MLTVYVWVLECFQDVSYKVTSPICLGTATTKDGGFSSRKPVRMRPFMSTSTASVHFLTSMAVTWRSIAHWSDQTTFWLEVDVGLKCSKGCIFVFLFGCKQK